MSTHLPYSASATDRWIACPASVKASLSIPQQVVQAVEEDYTNEGTRAHEIAETLLRGHELDTKPDEELLDIAMLYVGFVEDLRKNNAVVWEAVETLVAHEDYPDFGGSPDYACLYQEDGKFVLHVVDFKAGVGLAVDVEDNSQLLSYSAVLNTTLPVTINLFRMTVIQPRSYNSDQVKTTEVYRESIDAHMFRVEEAMKQDHFKTGQHCRFCPVASRCEALLTVIESLPQLEGAVPDHEVKDRWLAIHDLATTIRNVLDQIQAELVNLARTGEELPGHKIVESRSHRHWSADEKEIISALRKLGIKKSDVYSEPKLLSPAQIEKLGDKKAIKAAITPLVSQTVSALRVVPVDAGGAPVTFGEEFNEF